MSLSKPFSQPVVPSQPGTEFYGVQELALFKTFTRDSYRTAFGVEAPAFDPSRPVKTWFDSTVDTSDPANIAVYKVAGRDQAGNWTTRQMVLPAVEAAAVNLPGSVSYPAYVVPPTNANRGGSGINPNYLCVESGARALMAELGGDSLADEGDAAVFPINYPPEEKRRVWNFLFRGRPVNAGMLIFNRNAKGIGAPGHWDLSTGEPVWAPALPAPTGLDDPRPPRDMAVRELLPNERFHTGLMGVSIVRTDLQQVFQFTPEDRAVLRAIYQAVIKS